MLNKRLEAIKKAMEAGELEPATEQEKEDMKYFFDTLDELGIKAMPGQNMTVRETADLLKKMRAAGEF